MTNLRLSTALDGQFAHDVLAPNYKKLYRKSPPDFEEVMRWCCSDCNFPWAIWIIQEDGTDVGLIRANYAGEKEPASIWIFILPEHQHKGIGARALKQFYEISERWDFSVMVITEPDNEPMIKLAKKIGLKQKRVRLDEVKS